MHAALLIAVFHLHDRLTQRGLGIGDSEGRPSGGRRVNFFALPAAPAPAPVSLPEAPHIALTTIPTLSTVKIDVPSIAPRLSPALPEVGMMGATGAGAAGGNGVGPPAGGVGAGSGTGGAGDYISPASPRTTYVPPLAKVPGSLAGRTYRIWFWVAADGHVTRVEVDPPMHDEPYRREFLERMMAYRFYPARTRDGTNVAGVFTAAITLGN